MKKSKKNPGFHTVQAHIARNQGISMERAGAILASAGRNASKKAKKANPRLGKIKGMDCC